MSRIGARGEDGRDDTAGYGLTRCRVQERPPSRVVQIASVLKETRAVLASCQPSDGGYAVSRVAGANGFSVVCHVAPPSFVTTTPYSCSSEYAIAIVCADPAATGEKKALSGMLGTFSGGPNVSPRSVETRMVPGS